ncbi:MAG: general stress protein [Candidatus Latescibacteria bacterium]|nr:general stress protein [bacterium]MBD3425178.1 general stress protein [Candidatus Latescibacterota bacterium]
MADLRQRILEITGKPNMTGFATVTEDGAPWVRYVMAVASDDMSIRFSSFLESRKVSHIENDPRVHLVCGVTDPEKWDSYIQIAGTAEVVTDLEEKKEFWNPMIAEYFEGPEDPNYVIIKVTPSRIEYYGKENMEMEVWTP